MVKFWGQEGICGRAGPDIMSVEGLIVLLFDLAPPVKRL